MDITINSNKIIYLHGSKQTLPVLLPWGAGGILIAKNL